MRPQEIFLLVFSLVVVAILMAVNTYILKLYLHPDDKGLLKSPYGKIIIVLGLTICQGQALMVPLDVAIKGASIQNTNCTQNCSEFQMGVYWIIVYIVLLTLVCFFIPFAIFFYQSDPQNSFIQRLLRSFCYLFFTLLISCAILFISYIFLRYADIPYMELSLQSTQTQDRQKTIQTSKQITGVETSLSIYIVAIISFVGWIPLVFFGGVGLFALPIDLINQFRFRPKVRKSQQMKITKQKLIKQVKNLIQEGENLQNYDKQYENNDEAGCFQKFKGSRKANTKFTKFKVKYYLLNEQFSVFNLQLKLANANPIIPFFKLVLGIFFIITSLLWIVQIIFGNIAKVYNDDRPLIQFLNNLLIFMDERKAGLVSTIIFAYLCVYIMWCVQKGSIKMGMRIPFCCRFYPMKQNQTAINSFLVNVLFMAFASVGVIQLCVSSFPTYTRQAQINTILNVDIKYMRFYRIFYEKSIFPTAMMAWTFLTLLYLLITCNQAPKYMRDVAQIRQYHQEEIQKLN